jgi:hypothetical protein
MAARSKLLVRRTLSADAAASAMARSTCSGPIGRFSPAMKPSLSPSDILVFLTVIRATLRTIVRAQQIELGQLRLFDAQHTELTP